MTLNIDACVAKPLIDGFLLALLMRNSIMGKTGIDWAIIDRTKVKHNKLPACLRKPLGREHDGRKVRAQLGKSGRNDKAERQPEVQQGIPSSAVKSS